MAKRCTRAQFSPHLGRVLGFLERLAGEPDAKSEDKKTRTETVIGAYGKVCLYQLDSSTDQKSQERLSNFLQCLPLQTDPEEAKYINQLFLKEITKQNKNLMANDFLVQQSKEVLVRMNQLVSNNPEAEILDNAGKLLLQQVLSS